MTLSKSWASACPNSGGLAIPAGGHGIVLWHALTEVIHVPKQELCFGITLFGSLARPVDGFGIILRNAFAKQIRRPHVGLGLRHAPTRQPCDTSWRPWQDPAVIPVRADTIAPRRTGLQPVPVRQPWRNQLMALASSCETPWPFVYMSARLNWAFASPCSAALRYQWAGLGIVLWHALTEVIHVPKTVLGIWHRPARPTA